MRKLLTLLVMVFTATLFFACSDGCSCSSKTPCNHECKPCDKPCNCSTTDPYAITSVADLQNLATAVNNGNDFAGKTIRLMNNLNLSSIANWTPIGTENNRFKGTFDGQNHTISGLTINRPTADHQGLFGFTDDAKFLNIKIFDASVIGGNFVGTLVGRGDYGTVIKNSSAKDVSVEAKGTRAGGLAGQVLKEGRMENCFVDGAVVKSGGHVSGGLLGTLANNSILSNSYAINVEVIGGGDNCGVLVGDLGAGQILNSYAIGSVKTPSNQVDGLAYRSAGASSQITNSFHSTTVNGTQRGLELSEMKDQETFVGWDFDKIWDISPDKNGGFPTLR